ncbi:hypothetical protein DW089_00825 [Acidaminococcus sp. AM05-11]|nr:hypothetical protein DW089_00825 [Acidaminococcus sp. AM05-11]
MAPWIWQINLWKAKAFLEFKIYSLKENPEAAASGFSLTIGQIWTFVQWERKKKLYKKILQMIIMQK